MHASPQSTRQPPSIHMQLECNYVVCMGSAGGINLVQNDLRMAIGVHRRCRDIVESSQHKLRHSNGVSVTAPDGRTERHHSRPGATAYSIMMQTCRSFSACFSLSSCGLRHRGCCAECHMESQSLSLSHSTSRQLPPSPIELDLTSRAFHCEGGSPRASA